MNGKTLHGLGALLGGLLAARAAAADTTLTLDGNVPTDGPDHFYVPFDVPAGTQELEILHSDESDQNILDWGLYDQTGKWRGYGGGNSENVVINTAAASRGNSIVARPNGRRIAAPANVVITRCAR